MRNMNQNVLNTGLKEGNTKDIHRKKLTNHCQHQVTKLSIKLVLRLLK